MHKLRVSTETFWELYPSVNKSSQRRKAAGLIVTLQLSPVPELSFLPAPNIGAEPGRAKGESRITCMRMLRTPPFFPPKSGEKTIFGSTFQIRLGARFSE